MQTEEQFKAWLGKVEALFAEVSLAKRDAETLICFMLSEARYKELIGMGRFNRKQQQKLARLKAEFDRSLPQIFAKAYLAA